MHDHPYAHSVGPHDVMAAWLVCLVVAGSLFIYPLVAAGAANPAVEAHAVPHTMPARPSTEICAVRNSLVEIRRS
jgi:hypothetical protein